MEDTHIDFLFGASESPSFDIYCHHMQCDSKLKGVSIPLYLSSFEIPAKYITKVKKQTLPNCWVYASTAMYETFLLSQGAVVSGKDDEAILSETYMTYAAFDTNPSDVSYKNPYGKQVIRNPQNTKDYGGTVQTDALAFFIRGEAHTEEKADPLDPDTKFSKELTPRLRTITEQKCRSGYVTGFKFIGSPKMPYPDQNFIDEIKKNLLIYGPITIGFFFSSERTTLVNNRLACCCDAAHLINPPTKSGAHTICIIGWDDNYPASNFNKNFRPKNNGAFLAKNSWGTRPDYDGYLWLSYEDETMNQACCITKADTSFSSKPLKVINHGNFGPCYFYMPVNKDQINFRCIFTTTGSNDILDSIGFVCNAPCLADVDLIYNNKTTVLFHNLLLEYAGYQVKQVPFSFEFYNKNESFEISVTYKSINNHPAGIPLEYNDQKYYTNVNVKNGTCFIDNVDVVDLANTDKKGYGNIVFSVILKANSASAQNAVSGYENITVPTSSGGKIRGLCTDYGLVPVEWRLEPYGTSNYYSGYQTSATKYQITDAQNQVIEQGIVNTNTAAASDIYLTAIIGETDEIIMRKRFKCRLDAPAAYPFTVSSVRDDNIVDVSGNFGVANAEVIIRCNNQTQKTVTAKNGAWEIKNFEMYDAAAGWKDAYENSSIIVEIYDNQKAPVKICSGVKTVSLSKPFEVKKDSKGGLIITIIGVSAVVGIGTALFYCAANGSASCPITITLSGRQYKIGRGFAKNQGYTRLNGPDSGPRAELILEDGPFNQITEAKNLNVTLKKVKIDTVNEAENSRYYGGFTKELSAGGSVKNCTFTGEIESGGKTNVGVVLSEGKDVEIANCKTSVTVTGAASCGGIAYRLTGSSSVTACEVTGALSSTENAGGITVELEDGYISDCYVTSDISGSHVAGIVPLMSDSATIRHCYVSGRIQAAENGQACGIAPGIEGNKNAVVQNISVCSHISGDKIARVSIFPGNENIAYAGMHSDSGKIFSEDGSVLKDWYDFGTSTLYESMGFDMSNVWEFVDAMKFLRLKGSETLYNYPFYIIAETENGKFQVKKGSELTLTGFKNAAMPDIRWTGITPQLGLRSSNENFWTSNHTFVLTVPFIPTQAGTYHLLLSGTMDGDVYAVTLPFEVL